MIDSKQPTPNTSHAPPTLSHHPAYLLHGESQTVEQIVEHSLQKFFCKQSSDECFCSSCRHITNQQHHSIVWLHHNDAYTNKDIAVIFEKLRFQLEPEHHFFFIVPAADLLSVTCANRLLKSIEEPPTGYHFIFTTSNPESVLPTIRSRCVQYACISTRDQQTHSHLQTLLLTKGTDSDPFAFEKALNQAQLNHFQARALAHDVLLTLHTKFTQLSAADAPADHIDRLRTACALVEKRLEQPPQSGSAKLFLKTLYLALPDGRL